MGGTRTVLKHLDVAKIESKIAANLITSPATSPEGKRQYQEIERGLRRLKKNKPTTYQSKFWALVKAFEAFDTELSSQAFREIDDFNDRYKKKPA